MTLSRGILLIVVLLAFPRLLGASILTSYSFSAPYLQGAQPLSTLVQGSDGYYGTTYEGGAFGYGTIFKMTSTGAITTLVSFNYTNGANPVGSLILASDGNFYGTCAYGGSSGNGTPYTGYGTVFRMTPAGVLTTMVNFNGTNGANPAFALVQTSDGNFYGTTGRGGSSNEGTAFQMTLGGVLNTLVNFTGTNGSNPNGLMRASDGNFYGTTEYGGSTSDGTQYSGEGTVFKMTSTGVLNTLVNFSDSTTGSFPFCVLVQGKDGILYGTTESGGSSYTSYNGTVFKLTLAGTLTTLVNFSGTNGDSANGLIQGSDGNFYGITYQGGSLDQGSVFKITPGGTLTTLVNFTGANGSSPNATLIQGSDGYFYSTTQLGGSSNNGTVFKMTSGGSLTTLVNFISTNPANPDSPMVQGIDGNFYGTTTVGGTSGNGTVFKMTSGGVLTTVANFTSTNGSGPNGLIQGSDGNFYGTTSGGGTSGDGTVFKMTSGGVLTTLASFNFTNGSEVNAPLVLGNDGNFYGTTGGGGSSYDGTVFKMTSAGVLTTLVNFNNTNGNYPSGALIQGRDGNFYGMTLGGGSTSSDGSFGDGTVFKMNPGGALITLVNFSGTNGSAPQAELVQGSDGNFYGTTGGGGSSGDGTVFEMTTGGVVTTLINFNNSNGNAPSGLMIQGSDGNFYGTTRGGGTTGDGTIFEMMSGGTLTTLMNFNGNDGANPTGVIQGSDGNFYGTTSDGGMANAGSVFRFDPSNAENISFSSTATIPFVSTNYAITGSALNLSLNYAPAPGDVLTVVQNTGTTPISGTFTNLPDGGTITAAYNGINYTFTANYAGNADGQDLTLTLNSSGPVPSDTPLLPTWAWLVLVAAIFVIGVRGLPTARGSESTSGR